MQPKIYSAEQHRIDPHFVDKDAIYVISKLREAGFVAYLVGGGVRDLLCQRTPKDFDISTSARPEQIKRLFNKRCILIGRRFRLAHIRFGHKVLEVSTFRAGENSDDLIIQDNVWGTPEDDVRRRDFTINGLFYDPETNTVIDYVDGWQDLQAKLLRTIGDPYIRFKQDPVRMIRLLKFRARFDFRIEESTGKALHVCRTEIIKSSQARLLEEILRMLESGAATSFFCLMAKTHFFEQLFPMLHKFLLSSDALRCYNLLAAIDNFHGQVSNTIDRSILFAALLYPLLQNELHEQYLNKGVIPHISEVTLLTLTLVKNFATDSFSQFPRRLTTLASAILAIQYRLTPLSGKKHHRSKMIRSLEFDLALQLLFLRTQVEPSLTSDYESWLHARQQQDKADHPHQHTTTLARKEALAPIHHRHKRKKSDLRHVPPAP